MHFMYSCIVHRNISMAVEETYVCICVLLRDGIKQWRHKLNSSRVRRLDHIHTRYIRPYFKTQIKTQKKYFLK